MKISFLLVVTSLPLLGQPKITVSPASMPLRSSVTVTVSGGPSFRDSWVSAYAAGNVVPGQFLPCCWSWLDGTQTANPPATILTSATLQFTLPSAGSFVFVFQGGTGANGPFNPIATSSVVTVTAAGCPAITVLAPLVYNASSCVVSCPTCVIPDGTGSVMFAGTVTAKQVQTNGTGLGALAIPGTANGYACWLNGIVISKSSPCI